MCSLKHSRIRLPSKPTELPSTTSSAQQPAKNSTLKHQQLPSWRKLYDCIRLIVLFFREEVGLEKGRMYVSSEIGRESQIYISNQTFPEHIRQRINFFSRKVLHPKSIRICAQLCLVFPKISKFQLKLQITICNFPIYLLSFIKYQIIPNQMDKTLERSAIDILNIEPPTNITDPSISDGSHIIYSNQHFFTIKIQQKPQTLQTLKEPEPLRVKIMVEIQQGNAKQLKIELTSDSQIYFNFIFQCNQWDFKRIKTMQNFFIQFREYPDFIVKNFDKLKTNDKYFANFTIFSETEGKLDLIRKSQFKNDIIMQFDFIKSKEEQISKSIQYRYNLMRYEYQQYKLKYDSICDTIKLKNPSLAIQIQKIHKK